MSQPIQTCFFCSFFLGGAATRDNVLLTMDGIELIISPSTQVNSHTLAVLSALLEFPGHVHATGLMPQMFLVAHLGPSRAILLLSEFLSAVLE